MENTEKRYLTKFYEKDKIQNRIIFLFLSQYFSQELHNMKFI